MFKVGDYSVLTMDVDGSGYIYYLKSNSKVCKVETSFIPNAFKNDFDRIDLSEKCKNLIP